MRRVCTAACLVSVGCLSLPPPRRIHLVVNPVGGGGAGLEIRDAVLPIFEAAGVQVETLLTKYAGHAGEYARTVPLHDGFVGIGGDGTAHEIANGMLRRPEAERVPVGVIPAGSGNCWAFDLGVDDAISAATSIARGDTAAVDVLAIGPIDDPGRVDAYAVNICGYGMPAAVLEQANALRWLTGIAQYELAGLVLIASGRTSWAATLSLTAADGTVSTRTLEQLSFAQAQLNQHMGKRVPFAPGARMDDGLLDLVLVTRGGGLDIVYSNALARTGEHTRLPFVEVVQCRSFTLTPAPAEGGAPPPLEALNLDGELSASSAPFRASCVPAALTCYSSRLRTEPNAGGNEDLLYSIAKLAFRL